jgi:uncharacterized protein (DUF488 family)
MDSLVVYTIGQGKRGIADLVSTLEFHSVRYLCDVRTVPVSHHAPAFCKDAMRDTLIRHGMTYVYFGDTLGGRPSDNGLYRNDGLLDYALLMSSERFQGGIDRVVRGAQSGHVLAIFCSEGKPERCHRSKAVGRALFDRGIRVLHVDDDDAVVEQRDVLARLEPPLSLLDNEVDPSLVSRRRYR